MIELPTLLRANLLPYTFGHDGRGRPTGRDIMVKRMGYRLAQGISKVEWIYRESENHRVRASLLQTIQIVEFFLWLS